MNAYAFIGGEGEKFCAQSISTEGRCVCGQLVSPSRYEYRLYTAYIYCTDIKISVDV